MKDVLSLSRKLIVGAGLFGVAATLAPFAAAQQNSSVSGGLAGYVKDPTGAAVPNAKVSLKGPQQTLALTTDAQGRYEARGLPPGMYQLTVTATGFSTQVSKDNEVTIDHTSSLDLTLSLGQETTTVEVEGGATQIDTEDTSVNTQLSNTFLEQLPLPRNVAGAFYVAPGVTSGGGTGSSNPSIGGSSGLENNYTADGVTITDQAYGGLGVYTPQYGSLGTGINTTFIKEVDVKTIAFEPKYGQGDGGIVEIVTKAGSNQYHGSVGFYITPQGAFARQRQLADFGYVVTTPPLLLTTPQYEAAAQFGGYILKDKLFFFGAFDPTLNRNEYLPNPAAPLFSKGERFLSTTALSWSGKLTYTPFSSSVVELSSYGDPSKRNVGPGCAPGSITCVNFSGPSYSSVSDSYNFGTRNSIARVDSALWKGVTGSLGYYYSTEHFADTPSLNAYSVSSRAAQPYTTYGFGTYYQTRDTNYAIQAELQGSGNFLGKHTGSIGYFYNHVDFQNATLRTGANFNIPNTNAAGASINVPSAAVGKASNATYYLLRADGPKKAADFAVHNGNVGCTYCANFNGDQVYLQQIRGTWNGSYVSAIDRYHAAYGNEVYSPNRYVTINAGLRWEQQAYGGSLLTYHWQDNWSPRLGITVDPLGDRKSKVFFAYSRYQNPLPLDAAVRQLGNEQDDTSFYFAPITDSANNVVLDANGSAQPDYAKGALNATTLCTSAACTKQGTFSQPNFASSTGEGIIPGTKMEYANEYVLGVERELKPGMVAKMRYVDRHFGRIVEDIGSQSPEDAAVLTSPYAGGIANVSAGTDLFKNETEVTYTPAQFAAVNGGRNPGQVTPATYVAPAAGCTYDNDTSVQNGGFFQHFDGSPYSGACVTNATTADTLGADGKPDGFADPRRHYQAFEVELDRNFRNHWQARINYRFAKLFGNYEGFYRNDNAQSDPGISSLFDFTQGAIGLLGDQFRRGYLPSDRRNVANALISYTFSKDTPYFGRLNGVSVGTYIHGLSGVPLSAFQSHPVYQNVGEIPVGGRGTVGTTAYNLYADANVADTFTVKEKYSIRAAFDGFNITNSQPEVNRNQNLDTAPGSPNADYNKPSSFVQAFHGRFSLELSF